MFSTAVRHWILIREIILYHTVGWYAKSSGQEIPQRAKEKSASVSLENEDSEDKPLLSDPWTQSKTS